MLLNGEENCADWPLYCSDLVIAISLTGSDQTWGIVVLCVDGWEVVHNWCRITVHGWFYVKGKVI